ncbi:MAG: hypothetical protein OQK82_06005 [Candidatus Pacearchaeota archaeon]|nr:hypothetical protein [Candidatus Pacearchaeota archaeon]
MNQTLKIDRLSEIRNDLEAIAKISPDSVIRIINEGDRVKKSLGFDYKIDDVQAVRKICDHSNRTPDVYYAAIFNHFNNPYDVTTESLFNNNSFVDNKRKVLPFSRVLEKQVGECAEKAISMQLNIQDKVESSYISGWMSIDDDFAVPHAYNIMLSPKKGPFLIDVENTNFVDGKLRPYIVPISEIDKDTIIHIDNVDDGRVYGIL